MLKTKCGGQLAKLVEASDTDISVIEDTIASRMKHGVAQTVAEVHGVREALAQLAIERKNVMKAIDEQHPAARAALDTKARALPPPEAGPEPTAVDELAGMMGGTPEPAGSRAKGSAPGPKALAAKKAALLEATSSSDPALHKELATSTDAKGLQRAVEVLAKDAPQSEALKVANARLGALIKGSEDVAYGLQTKKYSLNPEPLPTEAEIRARQEYLNNPPKDYTTAAAREHVKWALREKARADAEYDKIKRGSDDDAIDALSDVRAGLEGVIEKGKRVLEGDASLKELEYSLDATKATGTEADAATRKAVEDHLQSVLGPKVSVAWKGLSDMAYAGDYDHQLKAIRLSVHAVNPMGTGFHESLHAFLGAMKDAGAHDVQAVLEKAAQSDHMLKQLRDIYKGNEAVLKQLENPEERAAYMYQHWALDKANFKVSMPANTLFGKIKEFVNKLLGTWSNDERALHIMKYFNEGGYARSADKPNYVRDAMMNTHRSQILETAKSFTEPLAQMADAVFGAGGARLRDLGPPSLFKLADIIKRDHTDASGGDRGFIPIARMEITKRMRDLGERMEAALPAPENNSLLAKAAGYKSGALSRDEIMTKALKTLQGGERSDSPEANMFANQIKKYLRETHDYMRVAGVSIGDLGKDYFPRVWDTHYISKNQQAFRDMLEPYIRSGKMTGTADGLIRNLISRGGNEFGIEARDLKETSQPGMQFGKERLLNFIDARDAEQFMSKDLMGTMSSYVTQAVRKAEWTRRLGNGKLEALMEQAKKEGATPYQLDVAEDYLKGVDGTLGDGLNPTARRLMGNMIVYQNIRLLPMASFSMLIDPLGTVVRGAQVGEAWSTFKRGMVGITQTFKKEGSITPDLQTKWAETVGTVDSAMMSHAMGDIYTQGMVGGGAKTMNDQFFKYNFVEGLNRNFRIGATESAMKFIQRHGDWTESKHSERWIKELGLFKSDIKTTADGHLALSKSDGLTAEQETRVHAAINQWVDGAVLRPDAADKPIWFNDPHFALIAHLKQFVYSFQKNILARVAHEVGHGNYTPMMALASYVPVMMAADFAKGMLISGGGVPQWQQGWGPAEYLEYAAERSGLFGVGQFGVDIAKDLHRGNTGLFALSGPSIEQMRDVVETVGGHKQFGHTAIDAMPANALYKNNLLNAPETSGGPTFAD